MSDGTTSLEFAGGFIQGAIPGGMSLFRENTLFCQLLNTAVKEVFNSPGGNRDNMIGHRVHTQRASNLRYGCCAKFYTSFTATIFYLIGIEPTHADEQFISQIGN